MNILVTAPFSELFRERLRNTAEKYGCDISFGTDSSRLAAAEIIIGDITEKLICDICEENIRRYLNDEPLRNPVPPRLGYAYGCSTV